MKTAHYYHVEYVVKIGPKDWTPHVLVIRDPGEAEAVAKFRRDLADMYACVRVTGPHEHCVPS